MASSVNRFPRTVTTTIIWLLCVGRSAAQEAAAPDLIRGPHLQSLRPSSVGLAWKSEGLGHRREARFASLDDPEQSLSSIVVSSWVTCSGPPDPISTCHRACLTGLEPDTPDQYELFIAGLRRRDLDPQRPFRVDPTRLRARREYQRRSVSRH